VVNCQSAYLDRRTPDKQTLIEEIAALVLGECRIYRALPGDPKRGPPDYPRGGGQAEQDHVLQARSTLAGQAPPGGAAAVCEVDPLDIVETIREGMFVRDPDLTGRLGYRSFGDTFTVLLEDSPREKEGLQ